MTSQPKLLYVVTEDWYFCSHRLNLAKAARDAGYSVGVVTGVMHHDDEILKAGFRLIPLRIDRGGMGPLRDLRSLLGLIRIYRKERPDLVHHVALKPVIFGTSAAVVSGVPCIVNAMAGLGFVFTSSGTKARILRWIVERVFRFLLSGQNRKLVLQNSDDRKMLVGRGIVSAECTALIRGSGVDVEKFFPMPEPEGVPLVVLPARMLWDKGVGEFVAAAKLLRESSVKARFVLVGGTDSKNPANITERQLRAWVEEGDVEWWGHVSDMFSVLRQSHIVCLPSYREGLPKALLEGASCGRPLIATDTPGCREIVKHSENGFLVPVRNSDALAEALSRLLGDSSLRKSMGARGRALVVREFSDRVVAEETLSLYEKLLAKRGAVVSSA